MARQILIQPTITKRPPAPIDTRTPSGKTLPY